MTVYTGIKVKVQKWKKTRFAFTPCADFNHTTISKQYDYAPEVTVNEKLNLFLLSATDYLFQKNVFF